MKILNLLESVNRLNQLNEMDKEDLRLIQSSLGSFFRQNYNFTFIMTYHAEIERMLRDSTRAKVTVDDFIYTLKTLCGGSNKKFQKEIESKNFFEGTVTNYSNNLNITFCYDARRKEFRIMTAMIKENYKNDNPRYRDTIRFGVR